MKNKTLLTATWIITILFGFYFILRWFQLTQIVTPYGSPATSIPVVIGMLTFCSIIPIIMWTITYFVGKNERKEIKQSEKKTLTKNIPNKNGNTKVQECITETNTFEKLEILKFKINELAETNVLNAVEAEQKIKFIDNKIEKIELANKEKINYDKSLLNLGILKKEGIITESEYSLKLVKLESDSQTSPLYSPNYRSFTNEVSSTENNNIAYSKAKEKEYSIALIFANKAIDLNKSNHFAYVTRGHIKYYLQDYNGALEDINKSIQLDAQDAYKFYIRGYINKKMGNLEAAILDWVQSDEMGNKDANSALLTNTNIELTKLDSDYCPDHIYSENYPQFTNESKSTENYNIAYSKAKEKNYIEALIFANLSIELNNNNHAAYDTRGYIKYFLKDYTGALADLNESIQLDAQDDNKFYHRGYINKELGNIEEAILDWKQSATMGNKGAQTALKYKYKY